MKGGKEEILFMKPIRAISGYIWGFEEVWNATPRKVSLNIWFCIALRVQLCEKQVLTFDQSRLESLVLVSQLLLTSKRIAYCILAFTNSRSLALNIWIAFHGNFPHTVGELSNRIEWLHAEILEIYKIRTESYSREIECDKDEKFIFRFSLFQCFYFLPQ